MRSLERVIFLTNEIRLFEQILMSPFHSSLLQSSSSVSHVNNAALLKFHVILSKVFQHLFTTYKLDLQIDFNIQTCNQDKKFRAIRCSQFQTLF